MLDRSHTSLPTATMGDNRRGAELDQNQQPEEVRERQAVPGDTDTYLEVEEANTTEDSRRAHPDSDEAVSHPVRE